MQEERQRLQEEDVGALSSVALSECCAAADYRAGALGSQRFQCMQGAAGGDNVIHDQDALAVHILDVLLVDDQRLLTGSRDGLILDDDRLTHIQLRTFAGGNPVFAALARHFVGQRDALGLGGQDHVKLGGFFQQSCGACLGQLHITEHDESGNIHSYQFVKSVIRSRVKGVYKEINALLDGSNDPALVTKYKDVMAQLPAMTELYEKRLALRKARGAMDIESDEAKLVMDEEGRCVDIVKRTRGVSECMIEEFMLLANQCAANAGRTHHVPFVYRIHEAPDAERMEKLSNTLKACGLNVHFAGEVPTQLELSAILDETRGQPIQIPVHTGILRSMQKARYSPEPKGHYGLVLADYAHFTSPIRRYPDLAIHRILTDMLVGKPEQELIKDYTGFATHASEQSSRQEVSAVRIERDVEDLYKAEYMHNHLGEVYTGTVAGITPRGVFVELDNTVEGFVPAAQLCKGEPQVIDGVSMLDPLTGKSWMLGSSMKIQVAAADVALGRIDFEYMVE